MSLRAETLQRGKRTKYRLGNYTPDWERKLELLALVGTSQEISLEFADSIAMKDQTSWESLLARLKTIQQQQQYRPGWVIHQAMACGNPPYWVLVELAKNAGFGSDRWASKQWKEYKGSFVEIPNLAAIDWAKWDRPEKKPVNKLIMLRPKPKE
jgi:hypothetical protein